MKTKTYNPRALECTTDLTRAYFAVEKSHGFRAAYQGAERAARALARPGDRAYLERYERPYPWTPVEQDKREPPWAELHCEFDDPFPRRRRLTRHDLPRRSRVTKRARNYANTGSYEGE